ncbi:MAG: hypothetical protein JKY52_05540 [Flavobacteriales bacterium]|nr:hypothetical protein [Flavobacteriales bacterium]
MLRQFGFISLLTVLFGGLYMWLQCWDYLDIHGSVYLSLQSLEESTANKTIVATYQPATDHVKNNSKTDPQVKLFLQVGLFHNRGAQFYGQGFYIGQKGLLPREARKINLGDNTGPVSEGQIDLAVGTDHVPKEIMVLDAANEPILTFELVEEYTDHQNLPRHKSYLKEWKLILLTK